MPLSLESLLAESKNQELWLAISQNRIADAQKAIAAKLPRDKKSLLGFLKAKAVQPNQVAQPDQAILRLALDVLIRKKWKPLSDLKWTIKEDADEQFTELIRFLVALHHNSRYTRELTLLINETFIVLKGLAKQVQVGADGYPRKTIAMQVWKSGFVIRQWCTPLAALFEEAGDIAGKANTLQNRTMITAAIMSHYPYTLGPDMIETAIAIEAAGETGIPRNYYYAIIDDFQRIADDIKANPQEQVMENEITSLRALKQAYDNLNRLNGTNLYSTELKFIATIIDRDPTYIPEDEDDEN